MIWKSIWKNWVPRCQHNKRKVSSTSFCNRWYFCIQIGFSIGISNLRICLSVKMERPSSSQILVLQEHLGCQSRLILMRLSPFGIDAQKFSCAKNTILWEWTFGLQVAFLQKWLKRDHSSWAIVKSIRFSRSSKFWEPQQRTTGLTLSSFLISNLHSLNSEVSQCSRILQLWTSLRWTSLRGLQLSIQTKESPLRWLYSTPILIL